MRDIKRTMAVLREAKEALLNLNEGRCFNSGHTPCQCTPCKIDAELQALEKELKPSVKDPHVRAAKARNDQRMKDIQEHPGQY